MGKLIGQRLIGRFGGRSTSGHGGNEHAGPFGGFPLGMGPWALRNYIVVWNDFTQMGDLDVQNFEWNRTDGSASPYAAGTAIARIPDWTPALIGAAGTVTIAPSLTSAKIIPDTNTVSAAYGILRVDAGSTDSTGSRVTRSFTGTNTANLVQLALTSTGDPTNNNSGNRQGNRQLSFGARFRVTETGTATQSALVFGLARDDEAHLTTGGAFAGAAGNFGFYKNLGTNALVAYTRTTANSTDTDTLTTIVPGTSTTTGTFVEVACVVELRSTSLMVMDCYVNGQYVLQHASTGTSSTPSADAYAPFFEIVNGVGADCTLDVDYYWMMGERF